MAQLGATQTLARWPTSDHESYNSCKELLEQTAENLHGAAGTGGSLTAEDYRKAEMHIINRIQQKSFSDELQLLMTGKPVLATSKLRDLSPELVTSQVNESGLGED